MISGIIIEISNCKIIRTTNAPIIYGLQIIFTMSFNLVCGRINKTAKPTTTAMVREMIEYSRLTREQFFHCNPLIYYKE